MANISRERTIKNPILNSSITAPVLLVAFNRPKTIDQVFDCIRKARPVRLYVALDGPRKSNKADTLLCKEVKNIVENVNWPCEVFYKINQVNKGAEVTVSSAISWVLEKEEYVIILEDDIIAPLSFFLFAQEMLELYKDEHQIFTVSGSNFTPIPIPENNDYFFAKYGHSWGWATWRRVWKLFDLDIEIQDEHLKTKFLKTICTSNSEIKYYKRVFQEMKDKGEGKSTWDTVGLYIFRVNNSLSVIPRVNLTSNIGTYGLHAHGVTNHHFRPVDEDFQIVRHPKKVIPFVKYDKHHFNTYINKSNSLIRRIVTFNKRAVKKVVKFILLRYKNQKNNARILYIKLF